MSVTITITVSPEAGVTEVDAASDTVRTGVEGEPVADAPTLEPAAGSSAADAQFDRAGSPAVPMELDELGLAGVRGATTADEASAPQELDDAVEEDPTAGADEPMPIEQLEKASKGTAAKSTKKKKPS